MFKKKFFLVAMCIFMAFGLFGLIGCSNDSDIPNETDIEKAQDYNVNLYYANAEYIQSGDETLEKFMPVYESTISGDTINIYKDTLEALKTVPEAGYETIITEQIKFNDVYVEGKTGYVDLGSEGLTGGSLSEIFLISQIVKTLMDSFQEIEEVQFLVDGEVVESLMGHFDASQPFTNEAFNE